MAACPAWQEGLQLSSALATGKRSGVEVMPCKKAFDWISPAPMPCCPGPLAASSGLGCCIS